MSNPYIADLKKSGGLSSFSRDSLFWVMRITNSAMIVINEENSNNCMKLTYRSDISIADPMVDQHITASSAYTYKSLLLFIIVFLPSLEMIEFQY